MSERRRVYISLGEWLYKRKYNELYEGYVINVGYAYYETKAITQNYNPNQSKTPWDRYNTTIKKVYPSEFLIYGTVREQHLDTSEEAIRESIPEAVPELTPGSTRERDFIQNHPIKAMKIGSFKRGSTNITTNAVRFATRGDILMQDTDVDNGEGNEVNAFRHVIWQSTITNKYNSKIAQEAGDAHEDDRPININDRHFTSLNDADMVIDLLNNEIGRKIGSGAPKKTPMNQIALLVLDIFYHDGLYTAVPTGNGTFYVDRTTITDEQYEELKQAFSDVNRVGRLPHEQEEQDRILAKKAVMLRQGIMIR